MLRNSSRSEYKNGYLNQIMNAPLNEKIMTNIEIFNELHLCNVKTIL